MYFLQLGVIVYDSRYVTNTGTVTVNMRVGRNENAPEFSENSYTFTIDETVGPFTRVGQVFATDKDALVSYKDY